MCIFVLVRYVFASSRHFCLFLLHCLIFGLSIFFPKDLYLIELEYFDIKSAVISMSPHLTMLFIPLSFVRLIFVVYFYARVLYNFYWTEESLFAKGLWFWSIQQTKGRQVVRSSDLSSEVKRHLFTTSAAPSPVLYRCFSNVRKANDKNKKQNQRRDYYHFIRLHLNIPHRVSLQRLSCQSYWKYC